jgi:hypothetical protein
MENLRIEATIVTPEVDFNCETNRLKIAGESYPENVTAFFEPIVAWLKEYLASGSGRAIEVDIELIMFNSSTSKMLMDVLFMLDEASENEGMITLNWRYDADNDMVEMFAEDFDEDFAGLTVNQVVTS